MRTHPFIPASPGLPIRFVPLFLLLLVGGCAPGKGKVAGQVTFNGAPLPGGRVTFQPADPRQNAVSVELDDQGRYAAELPAGDVAVSIDNRELEPRSPQTGGIPAGLPPDLRDKIRKAGGTASPPRPEGAPKSSGKYVAIPSRYYAAETSGLTFRVRGGQQTEDLPLTR
jgi:hypothetical protein